MVDRGYANARFPKPSWPDGVRDGADFLPHWQQSDPHHPVKIRWAGPGARALRGAA